MKNIYTYLSTTAFKVLTIFSILLLLFHRHDSFAQSTVIPSGSFIVNMGITPQTVANGMKPYGMV
ncbi:MAG: hypothetical protein WCI92_11965 [Bacteroidota bacterium]